LRRSPPSRIYLLAWIRRHEREVAPEALKKILATTPLRGKGAPDKDSASLCFIPIILLLRAVVSP
jgi:hypothetical protein